jgi:ribosomal protein L19
MAVKKKLMQSLFTTFMMRNIFAKVSVELCTTLYGLCRLNFKLLEYAKKRFSYRSSKLYYLREKLNIESWVKI